MAVPEATVVVAYHRIEDPSSYNTPLLHNCGGGGGGGNLRSRGRWVTTTIALACLLIVSVACIGLFTFTSKHGPATVHVSNGAMPVSRGRPEGVSEKTNRLVVGDANGPPYPWTNNMLTWQRTGFHFQPEKNWMNDPNGPMYYKGFYHFFYQYNPNGAVWGDIVWGHAVSKDFVHWTHLPVALVPDQWYDQNGVWSGSATLLPDGQVIILYTGSSNESAQLQNLAYPANLSDPLLVDWVKYPGNPIIGPPKGIYKKDFRDPTTAWRTSEGKWRITVGSKAGRTGAAFVYETEDFKTYRLLPGVLHAVPGTGMWECVDFFPVSINSKNGLDTSTNGKGVKHVMKVSLDDDRHDYYSVGTYDVIANTWTPDNPQNDVGIGIRYDYGVFYASKTFYDQKKGRRILWGWISESDSEKSDVLKGWASVQSIPRTLLLDQKTGTHLLQWPVEEIESLRLDGKDFNNIKVEAGAVIPLDVESSSQADVVAEFEVDKAAVEAVEVSPNEEFNCASSGGASQRGSLGPFGILVLADPSRSEQTSLHFYISKTSSGSLKTSFCTDQSRSSQASDVNKQIYGSFVPVLQGEKLSMRILVDHSIVEAFAQGGRTSITSRVYPTRAIYHNARIFLFNNATDASVLASVKIWPMNSASIQASSH
ncbi:hypothetical protein SAY87_015137 [Trapa incisa]|uniref:beta-fructofuranosidase n=1 Tax=Trapa incisa TaxID=236973 RepID=A0AAN7JDU9_9MYRT|nr:hypothetical protein SAY87_015137 [Trapa incisa]